MSIKNPALAIGVVLSSAAYAGLDQPWNELESGGTGDFAGGLVLLAAIAFVIHLVEKGEVDGFLRDLAKGLSFLATMYLMVFWFIACIAAAAFLLRALGLEKSTAGFIAFPAGLVLAYKLYGTYETWRRRKPTK